MACPLRADAAFRIIIKDGVENTFRSKPIVTVTTRKFDALRLVKAIVDYVEFRSFTCTDLKEYADELTHHIKAEEVRPGEVRPGEVRPP